MQKRSAFDWTLEGLAVIALSIIIGTVAVHWTELPAKVPRHYGISGSPDGWGNKNGMLLLPVTAVGLYLLLTATARYPRIANVPFAIDRDAPEVQRLLQSMSITLKTVILFVFAYMEWASVNTALGHSAGLGKLFLPLSLVSVILPLGFYMQRLRRHKI